VARADGRHRGQADLQAAGTAEWVNALCRNRGLWQMPVRGRPKCRIVALLYAITHNLMQAANLRAQAATMST
jgi:hypothetical protein